MWNYTCNIKQSFRALDLLLSDISSKFVECIFGAKQTGNMINFCDNKHTKVRTQALGVY